MKPPLPYIFRPVSIERGKRISFASALRKGRYGKYCAPLAHFGKFREGVFGDLRLDRRLRRAVCERPRRCGVRAGRAEGHRRIMQPGILSRPIFSRHRAWLSELCRIAVRLLSDAYAEAVDFHFGLSHFA
jgi:hypothetical protein